MRRDVRPAAGLPGSSRAAGRPRSPERLSDTTAPGGRDRAIRGRPDPQGHPDAAPARFARSARRGRGLAGDPGPVIGQEARPVGIEVGVPRLHRLKGGRQPRPAASGRAAERGSPATGSPRARYRGAIGGHKRRTQSLFYAQHRPQYLALIQYINRCGLIMHHESSSFPAFDSQNNRCQPYVPRLSVIEYHAIKNIHNRGTNITCI